MKKAIYFILASIVALSALFVGIKIGAQKKDRDELDKFRTDSIRKADSLYVIEIREQKIADSLTEVTRIIDSISESHKVRATVYYFNSWVSLFNNENKLVVKDAVITETENYFFVDLGFKTVFGPRILKYKKVKSQEVRTFSLTTTYEVYETSYPQVHLAFAKGVTEDNIIKFKLYGLFETGLTDKTEVTKVNEMALLSDNGKVNQKITDNEAGDIGITDRPGKESFYQYTSHEWMDMSKGFDYGASHPIKEETQIAETLYRIIVQFPNKKELIYEIVKAETFENGINYTVEINGIRKIITKSKLVSGDYCFGIEHEWMAVKIYEILPAGLD